MPAPVPPSVATKIQAYIDNGRVAWSEGYQEYKRQEIQKAIQNQQIIEAFKKTHLPEKYGFRLDERIVEYAWIFANLSRESKTMLDAGSTFNFDYLVNDEIIKNKYLFIHTYHPEMPSYHTNRISYVYGDLRELPYKDDFFDEIVCQSTIEHIDMDNSMYGYDITHHQKQEVKSYEYLKAVQETLRVLKSQGLFLLTFPYGKFENHGFFQQFDKEMLDQILLLMANIGNYELSFFRYTPEGWIVTSQESCQNIESFNPHTNRGKGTDGAAHCRSICCIKFVKL